MQCASNHKFPIPFPSPNIGVNHVVVNFQLSQEYVYKCVIFDFRVASNAKIIPRKSKEYPSNSDISFSGLYFFVILTF